MTIEKVIEGYCYPRNGNVHNPTPRVAWYVRDAEGRVVDRAATRQEALKYAEEYERQQKQTPHSGG